MRTNSINSYIIWRNMEQFTSNFGFFDNNVKPIECVYILNTDKDNKFDTGKIYDQRLTV